MIAYFLLSNFGKLNGLVASEGKGLLENVYLIYVGYLSASAIVDVTKKIILRKGIQKIRAYLFLIGMVPIIGYLFYVLINRPFEIGLVSSILLISAFSVLGASVLGYYYDQDRPNNFSRDKSPVLIQLTASAFNYIFRLLDPKGYSHYTRKVRANLKTDIHYYKYLLIKEGHGTNSRELFEKAIDRFSSEIHL